MNINIKLHNIKPGDEIIVPKSGWNLAQHHAVYIGADINGNDWIIENNVTDGVRIITAEKFFSLAEQINKINRFPGSNIERKALVQRALLTVGKPYNLINYNCQHFTSELLTGEPKSYQINNTVVALIAIFLIGIAFSE